MWALLRVGSAVEGADRLSPPMVPRRCQQSSHLDGTIHHRLIDRRLEQPSPLSDDLPTSQARTP